jgi:hypothetical protein
MIASSMSKFPAMNDTRRCPCFDGPAMGETLELRLHPLCAALGLTGRSDSRQFTLMYGCSRFSPRECQIVPPREVRVGHVERGAAIRKPYEDKGNGTALCVSGRFNKSSHHEPRERCHCESVLFTMIRAGHSGHRRPEGRTEDGGRHTACVCLRQQTW